MTAPLFPLFVDLRGFTALAGMMEAKALMALDAPRGVTGASAVLVDGNQSQSLRERLGVLLAERNTPESRAASW